MSKLYSVNIKSSLRAKYSFVILHSNAITQYLSGLDIGNLDIIRTSAL